MDNFDVCKDCIIFTAKDPDLDPALNVKTNVYISRISNWDGGSATLLKVVIPGFEGACTSPVLSADGKKAAFLAMKTAGYESDKNQIFVLQGLSNTELKPQRAFASDGNFKGDWDRSPSSICFAGDGKSLLVVAEDYGTGKLYSLDADITKNIEPKALTTRGYITDCKPLSGGQIFITATSLIDNSIFAIVDPLLPPGKPHQDFITWSHSNSGAGNKFGLHPSQVGSIWTPASNKKILENVHSLVVKPSNFDPSKTYPVAYLIHGGPQGSWADNWSTRWNPAVFAEQGYIVIAPNPTGSTGYGQDFTDSIRSNWGGDPYQDIVNCFEWVGKNMPQADNDRAVALGASYGGYMMNW
jgi:dipeptidyl aminopeptidase/acylaminoacyl peptidase